jgi:aminopeptidase YwaD
MKKIIILLLLFIFFIHSSCKRMWVNSDITTDELSGHIEFLASDSLKGRYPGTPEDFIAAMYITNEFKDAGLQWLTADGLQEYEIVTYIEAGDSNKLSFDGYTSEHGKDFTPLSFSSDTNVKAEVVFCGYGFDIDQEDLKWNDFRGIDVTGKWVMVLRGNPEPEKSISIFDTYSNERDKAMVAKDLGASGILFVSGPLFFQNDELMTLRSRESQTGIPAIHIKRAMADRILSISGQTTGIIEKELNDKLRPHSFPTGVILEATTNVIPHEVKTYNAVAFLEGSHPIKKDQYIIIGAHYDHLGFGGPGTSSRLQDSTAIHYGADDNASGVSGIIEIAERFALSENRPDRSLLFIAFGAEEMGLLGSRFFTENPLVPLEQVSLMVNLDMIGRMRDRHLQVSGTGTSAEAEEILKHFADTDSIQLIMNPEGFGPSDHSSFYGKDIPVLFLTTGVHADYHTPDDSPEKINYTGMVHVADFAYELIDSIARMDSLLTFKEAGPKVMPSARHGRGRVTLGIMPDITSTDDTPGMRVEFVSPGKPAELGGMKKGDMILAIDGKPVNNVYDYMFRLEKIRPGQLIIVTIKREEKQLDLLIQL